MFRKFEDWFTNLIKQLKTAYKVLFEHKGRCFWNSSICFLNDLLVSSKILKIIITCY